MKRLSEVKKNILKKIWETRKPVTPHEISEKLGLKIRSANAHLIGLRKTGFVTESEAGYTVTEQGLELIGLPKIDKQTSEKILRKTSPEQAFQFYTGIDHPLRVSSNSLSNLCEGIKLIDIGSIEFHIMRGDFESWIRHLGDIELEKRLRQIREASLTGDALQEKLYETLRSRYDELLKIVA